jgi:hypothetical protein
MALNLFRHAFRRTGAGVIFYPKGPAGPGYLIHDTHLADRLEVTLKVIGFISAGICGLILDLVIKGSLRWWWLLTILVPPALDWKVAESLADRMQPVYEPVTVEDTHLPPLPSTNAAWQWLLAVLAGAMGGAGLWMAAARQDVFLALAALFFATCAVVIVRQIRTKPGRQDRAAADFQRWLK